MIDERLGEHCGVVQKEFINEVPSDTSRSRLGV